MSEHLRIVAVDPSLRSTGVAVLNWNSETNQIWVTNCAVLRTPVKYKKLEAIYYMIGLIKEFSEKEEIVACDQAVVEFPAAFYNPKFSTGTLSPLSAISGAAYSFLNDFEKEPRAEMIYPTVWNKARNKRKTKDIIEELVGDQAHWQFDQAVKNPNMYEHVIDALGMAYYILERDYL